jgi:4-aminobutyrate aminotransferase
MLKDAAKTVTAIGDVRGHGLMIGVEVVADRKTREPLSPDKSGEIAMKVLNNGVIITPCGRYGNVFRLMPPLTIPHQYAFKAVEIMIDILKSY